MIQTGSFSVIFEVKQFSSEKLQNFENYYLQEKKITQQKYNKSTIDYINLYKAMQNDTPHSQSASVLDMSQTGKSQQTKHEMQRRSEQTFIQNSSLRTLEKMWMLIGKPMFRRKSRKPVGDSCSCQKSQCLKLYCQCFAKGKICNKECSCKGCLNKAENQIRSQTISQLITKDPLIFSKKQISTMQITCNCHRSKCRMKYCECFKTGNLCGSRCKCSGCENQVEKPWYSFDRQFPRKKVKLVQ